MNFSEYFGRTWDWYKWRDSHMNTKLKPKMNQTKMMKNPENTDEEE